MDRKSIGRAGGCAGLGMAMGLALFSLMHSGMSSLALAEGDTPFSADAALATPTPTRTPTPINVGNYVWSDLDGDGRQDAGEPGLAGVTVQLWNSTKTALINQTVTNANGNYTLVAPTPGNYRVRALLPGAGDQFSPKDNAAAGDQLDSDINTAGTNFGFTDIYVFGSNLISITTIDVGIVKFFTPTPTRTPTPINIGNLIWDDVNNNGRQDAGEPGVANVTVQLWNSTKTALIDQTVTNANGNYTVVAPIPGNYRVRVLLGIGSSFAPKDAGIATEQTDSDCNTAGVDLGFSDVFNLASNVISTVIYDCGLRGPYTTATATTEPTSTSTPTPTATPTLDADITVVPPAENPVYLPIVVR